jgi:hypothetical protein
MNNKLETLLSQMEKPDLTNFCIQHYVNVQSRFIDDCYELQLTQTPLMNKTEFVYLYTTYGSRQHATYAESFRRFYFGEQHKPKFEPVPAKHWGELDIQQHNGAK